MFDKHQLDSYGIYDVVGRYYDTYVHVLSGGSESIVYKTDRNTVVVVTSVGLNPLKHYLYELWELAKAPTIIMDNLLMTEMKLMNNVRQSGESYYKARDFILAMRDAFFFGADGNFYPDNPYTTRWMDMKKFVSNIPEEYKNMFSAISSDWVEWSDDLMVRNILELNGVMYPVDCFRALNDKWVGNLKEINYEHYI